MIHIYLIYWHELIGQIDRQPGTREDGVTPLSRQVSTQENKHGIGLDGNKIEPAHGLSVYQFLVPV